MQFKNVWLLLPVLSVGLTRHHRNRQFVLTQLNKTRKPQSDEVQMSVAQHRQLKALLAVVGGKLLPKVFQQARVCQTRQSRVHSLPETSAV